MQKVIKTEEYPNADTIVVTYEDGEVKKFVKEVIPVVPQEIVVPIGVDIILRAA